MDGMCKMHDYYNNSLFIVPCGNNNRLSHQQYVKARFKKVVGIEIQLVFFELGSLGIICIHIKMKGD
jgi:hypothetical protein